MKHKNITLTLIIMTVFIITAYTQLTFFVIQPIGALPEGKTIVIWRLNKTLFIDSADAMCERIQGGVSLFCRGIVLGKIVSEATILMRLPYSEYLYSISTNNRKYDR